MIISFGVIYSHLQSVMSERINFPGELYESCHQETANCSFPQGSGYRWMHCATNYLIINAPVDGSSYIIVYTYRQYK